MSTIIKLRCIDQVLTFESTPVIASGGLEEDALQVSFCSRWDGLAKTAVFWLPEAEEEAYHVPLDLADSCKIPREVLEKDGVFYFGIFGVSEDGRQRTTQALRYVVVKGAITSGTKPSDPTPDIYTQLMTRYAEVLAESQKVAQAAEEVQAAAEASAGAAASSQAAAAASQKAAEAAATRASKALAVDGSNAMTGDLYLANGLARIAASDGAVQIESRTEKGNTNRRRMLILRNQEEQADAANALGLIEVDEAGNAESFPVYHTRNKPTVEDVGAVPTTRKVNNKALSSDVTLTVEDVGAVPTTRKVNNKALSSDVSLTAEDVGAVPTTRKVNNKVLSSDVTLTAADVGAFGKNDTLAMGNGDPIIYPTSASGATRLRVYSGRDAAYNGGAGLILTNGKAGTCPGNFELYAHDGVASSPPVLRGLADGTLTWQNRAILHIGNLSELGVAKVEYGNYVGTGSGGASVTGSFEPKMLIITPAERWEISFGYENPFLSELVIWTKGLEESFGRSHTYGNYSRAYRQNGNTVSLDVTGTDDDTWLTEKMNLAGVTYHYILIG